MRRDDLKYHTRAEEHHRGHDRLPTTEPLRYGKDSKGSEEGGSVLRGDHDGANSGVVFESEVSLVALEREYATCIWM